MSPFLLTTDRLALRELEASDLDFVAALLAHPEVMRHYPAPRTREEAAASIAAHRERYRADGFSWWLALLRHAGTPVGLVGLACRDIEGVREPELGWMIHADHWRRGHATEAARAVRDWAFRTYPFDHLISLIRPVNVPSQGVARKLGMRETRRVLHAGLEHGVWTIRRDELPEASASGRR